MEMLWAASTRDESHPLNDGVGVAARICSILIRIFVVGRALIGVSVAWISGRRRRRELQRHRRRIEALERELSATQSQLENQAESVRPRLPASS